MNTKPFDPKKAYAITIGIGRRTGVNEDAEGLAITAADAEKITDELIGRVDLNEDQVIMLTEENATRGKIVQALDKLISATAVAPAELVVIYFSGHGCVGNDGQHYLICRDTENADFVNTGLAGSVFVDKLAAINTEKMLVLLDCCHSGGFYDADTRVKPADVPFDAKVIEQQPNRVILSASTAKQVSFVSKPLSIFTYALVEGLAGKFFEDGDKVVSLFKLALYVRERVYPLSRYRQQPQLNLKEGSLTSDFALVRYPNGRPKEAVFPEEFQLYTTDGSGAKSIVNTDIKPEVDEDFRKTFSWVVNIQGDDNIVLQDVKNSTVNITTSKVVNQTIINHIAATGDEKKFVFNEYLIKELMTAIAPYNKDAQQFLDDNAGNADWNQLADESGEAKLKLQTGYVGLISRQLSILFAIGLLPNDSIQVKKERYIENGIVTARRTLQLLCFACLSDIYSQAKRNKYSVHIADAAAGKTLSDFFNYNDSRDMGIMQYLQLLTSLQILYADPFVYTIAELKDFGSNLQMDSAFYKACANLAEINQKPVSSKYTLENCALVEINLVQVLGALGFLAQYNIVSIKSVNYEEIGNAAPLYLHKYENVGIVRGADMTGMRPDSPDASARGMRYVNKPVNTDSLLLYKANYMPTGNTSINLFPFIIDYNALNSLDDTMAGVRVCFYSASFTKEALQQKADENEDALFSSFQSPAAVTEKPEELMRFFFIDDNKEQIIRFKNVLRSGITPAEFFASDEKRKQAKLDNVFFQFRDAKEVIVG